VKVRQFVDSVKIFAAAGDGGNGCAHFRREKYIPYGGPDGGDGGLGGNVILRASPDVDSLQSLYFAPHQRAEPGGPGRGNNKHGKDGADLIVPVPLGTEAWDDDTQTLIGELLEPGSELVVARGGRGGLGNPHWKTSVHQAPREFTPGTEGDVKTIRLELKIAADFGLVGFPNSGKSSLISQLTHAHPKIGPYPFTTLNPIIGTLHFADYTKATIADIPGLIKGAYLGVGLGQRFLRHIERSAALIYVIDMAGSEDRDPIEDYRTLRNELDQYRHELLLRPSVIVANKMDLPEAADHLVAFRKATRTKPLPVSALTGKGLDDLKEALRKQIRWET
jgi:GTP-binding protein